MTGLIFEQIPKIMRDIKPIGKDQYNQQQKFKFRGIDDIYNHCQSVLAEHEVFTVPEIIGRERTQVVSRSGSKMFHCVNQYKFHFYAKDGSSFAAYADGEAMDTGDKASNKCAAIAHKYALLQVFCIPTADLQDPDSESPELAGKPDSPVNRVQQNQQPVNRVQQPVNQVQQNKTFPDVKNTISEAQARRLYAIRKSNGIEDKEFFEHLKTEYGVTSDRFLTPFQYNQICEALEGEIKNDGIPF